MSLFLSADELQELTDRVQPAAQARVLRAMGVDFLLHPNGRPKVLHSVLESCNLQRQQKSSVGPDLEAVYS